MDAFNDLLGSFQDTIVGENKKHHENSKIGAFNHLLKSFQNITSKIVNESSIEVITNFSSRNNKLNIDSIDDEEDIDEEKLKEKENKKNKHRNMAKWDKSYCSKNLTKGKATIDNSKGSCNKILPSNNQTSIETDDTMIPFKMNDNDNKNIMVEDEDVLHLYLDSENNLVSRLHVSKTSKKGNKKNETKK